MIFKPSLIAFLSLLLADCSAVYGQKILEEDREIRFSSPDDDAPVVKSKFDDQKLLLKLRKKYCKRFNGKMIAYYGLIYSVDKCKRRLVEDDNLLFEITKKKIRITPVDAEVVAALEEGDIMHTIGNAPLRTCKTLNKSYISFSDVDVYWVEACKKRRFPDWDSFVEHHNNLFGRRELSIESLTWKEFIGLKDGKQMPSMIDRTHPSDVVIGYEEQVDVIPLEEACKGVDGKVVSYYSKLYKVEKCRKRLLDAQRYLAENRNKRHRFIELSSEQWISLPDGRPFYKELLR